MFVRECVRGKGMRARMCVGVHVCVRERERGYRVGCRPIHYWGKVEWRSRRKICAYTIRKELSSV